MKLKKVKMVREDDEYVLCIAGREMPLIAIKTTIQMIFISVLVYTAFNIGQEVALTYANIIPPTHSCNGAECTDCTPYAVGNQVQWNCTTTKKPINMSDFNAPLGITD